jgi:branched-chain amino acid transport system permease protein
MSAHSRLRITVGVLAVVAAVAVPWLVDAYGAALLGRTLVLGLVAVSVTLLTGVAGLPTLGQTGPFAAAAYACALLGTHAQAVGSIGLVQLVAGAAVGALFALLASPLVVPARGVALLMITLAIGELVTIAAGRWRSVTGGTDGLTVFAETRPVWGLPPLADDRARYLYALVVVAVVVGGLFLALRGPAGLLLRARRDDEQRLRASGHDAAGLVLAAFVAAGAVAGVAGSLLVTTQQYVSPADFGFDVATLLLLGAVIGGTGSLGGAIVGTAVVLGTRDWLSGILPGRAPLLLGLVFIGAAYAFARHQAGPGPGGPSLPLAGPRRPRFARWARSCLSRRREPRTAP